LFTPVFFPLNFQSPVGFRSPFFRTPGHSSPPFFWKFYIGSAFQFCVRSPPCGDFFRNQYIFLFFEPLLLFSNLPPILLPPIPKDAVTRSLFSRVVQLQKFSSFFSFEDQTPFFFSARQLWIPRSPSPKWATALPEPFALLSL